MSRTVTKEHINSNVPVRLKGTNLGRNEMKPALVVGNEFRQICVILGVNIHNFISSVHFIH